MSTPAAQIRAALRAQGGWPSDTLPDTVEPHANQGRLEFWQVRGVICILQIFPDGRIEFFAPLDPMNKLESTLQAIQRLGVVIDTTDTGDAMTITFGPVASIYVSDRAHYHRLMTTFGFGPLIELLITQFSIQFSELDSWLNENPAPELADYLRKVHHHVQGKTNDLTFYI